MAIKFIFIFIIFVYLSIKNVKSVCDREPINAILTCHLNSKIECKRIEDRKKIEKDKEIGKKRNR
jgi:hypothetical protein